MSTRSECETPNRPYIIGWSWSKRHAVLFRPACGLWACPVCAQTNRARWAVRTYSGAKTLVENGQSIEFLTLTSHERLLPQQTIGVFRRAWNKLNVRARRARPAYQYVMVPEQHQDGRLHVHAVETADLGTRWWKDNGRECGLGYIAEETAVYSPEGAAWYVTKYISKSLGVVAWPEGFRRVRTSRGWPPLPKLETPDGWRFQVVHKHDKLADVVADFESQGFTVVTLGGKMAWQYVRGELPGSE